MTTNGLITAVSITRAGSAIAIAANLADSLIYVDDAADFNESGGSVEINGLIYAYTSADLEADTLALATGLSEALELGQPVYTSPGAYEKRADVMLDGFDDSVSVRVPHNLYDRLAEGIRQAGREESVVIDDSTGTLKLIDVIGLEPVIDGSFLDPQTVPQNVTDGLPPEVSPVPTAEGTIGVVLVKWTQIENADPVTYQVHVSTTEDFTEDATTLLGRTVGNFMIVRTLPSGAVLDYGVTYYFRLIAEDADGTALASDDVSASPRQATSADIAANYVYAGNILAEQITGGTIISNLTLASTIKTGDAGARVEISADGVLITDSTGTPTTRLGTDAVNFFKGVIEADGLTVNGGMTLRSTNNEISRGSSLTLAQGVTASTNAPTVVVDWERVGLKDSGGGNWYSAGGLRGLERTPDGKWLIADSVSAQVLKFNADGTHNASYNGDVGINGAAQPVSGGAIYTVRNQGTTTYISRLTKESIFSDAFSGTLGGWASSYGTTAIDTGRAKVTIPVSSTSGIKRALEGFFRTKTVDAKVTPPSVRPSGTDYYMKVTKDSSNDLYFLLRGNTLYMYTVLGGGVTAGSIAYNSTDHAYWQIAEMNGVVTFSTSADGTTWVSRRVVTHGLSKATLTGMTWDIGAVTPTAGTNNLLANGTFEVNANDWFIVSAYTAMHRDNTIKRSGTWSLRLDTTDNAFASVVAHSSPFSVTAGTVYDVNGYARAQEAGTQNTASIRVKWYNASNALIGTDSLPDQAISNAGFTLLTGSATAPVGATTARMEIYNNDSTGNDSKSWWDDLSVVEQGAGVTEIMFVDDAKYYAGIGQVAYSRVQYAGGVKGPSADQVPGLGSTGGNLLLAEFDDGRDFPDDPGPRNRYVVRHIDPNDMQTAIVATFTSAANSGFAGPVAGVQKGSFDMGEDRYLISRDNAAGTYWYPIKSSDGVYKPADAFPVITGGHRGAGWDGTNFWALSTDGSLAKHTNIKWTAGTDSDAWSVGFTWFDGGSQESGVSPYAAVTMKMRSRLTVTSPTIPYSGSGDPDRIKVYVGRGGGTKFYQAATGSMVNNAVLTSVTFSGSAAPTVSTFLSATPAKIRNSDDSLVVSADGSIKAKSINLDGRNIYAPILLRKSADQTVTNSATAVLDTHLRWTALANTNYIAQVLLFYGQNANATTADFKVGGLVPSGSWSAFGIFAPATVTNNVTGQAVDFAPIYGSVSTLFTVGIDGDSGAYTALRMDMTFNIGATGGNAGIQWAQGTAVASVGTVVKTNSFMRVEQV